MSNGEGVASVKCEAQAEILYMLQTWQSDLSLGQSQCNSSVYPSSGSVPFIIAQQMLSLLLLIAYSTQYV